MDLLTGNHCKHLCGGVFFFFHLDAQLLETDRTVWVDLQRLRDRNGQNEQISSVCQNYIMNSVMDLDIAPDGLIIYPRACSHFGLGSWHLTSLGMFFSSPPTSCKIMKTIKMLTAEEKAPVHTPVSADASLG